MTNLWTGINNKLILDDIELFTDLIFARCFIFVFARLCSVFSAVCCTIGNYVLAEPFFEIGVS